MIAIDVVAHGSSRCAPRGGTERGARWRTRSTSPATSPARSRCSSGSSRAAPAIPRATRSPRSSSPCSCSLAAGRLMRRNVDVLMDRAPADAEEAARAAIAALEPPVELSRLRLRQAAGRALRRRRDRRLAGRGGRPGPRRRRRGRGGGRAGAAGQRRRRPRRARRRRGGAPRARARRGARASRACARSTTSAVVDVGGAHRGVAAPEAARRPAARGGARGRRGGRARDRAAVPEVDVRADAPRAARRGERRRRGSSTRPRSSGSCARRRRRRRASCASCAPTRGSSPSSRSALDPASTLADAHARASEVEERMRRALPEIADVIVHTEP